MVAVGPFRKLMPEREACAISTCPEDSAGDYTGLCSEHAEQWAAASMRKPCAGAFLERLESRWAQLRAFIRRTEALDRLGSWVRMPPNLFPEKAS